MLKKDDFSLKLKIFFSSWFFEIIFPRGYLNRNKLYKILLKYLEVEAHKSNTTYTAQYLTQFKVKGKIKKKCKNYGNFRFDLTT